MASEENFASKASTTLPKAKRARKLNRISLESGQRGIASAMAKIINHMVNEEMQQRCKQLLEMEDFAETEARILFILQQIDKERSEEDAKQEGRKSKKLRKTYNGWN